MNTPTPPASASKEASTITAVLHTKGECLLHLNRNDEFFKCQDEIFARDGSETKVLINKGSMYF